MKATVPSLNQVLEANWLFDEANARRIISAVGEPTWIKIEDLPEGVVGDSTDPVAAAMAWHLSRLAFDYRFAFREQSQPRAGEVEKFARRVSDRARRLTEALTDESGEIQAGLGPGALYAFAALDGHESGAARVQEILAAVRDLQRWSLLVADRKVREHRAKPPSAGRKRDKAFHDLIKHIGGVYYFYFGRRPGFSRSPRSGQPYGPFVRFLKECLSVILPDWTKRAGDEAIASIISEHRWRSA